MALSIGISVGSRIDIEGHVLQVKALKAPDIVMVTVDQGDAILVNESQAVQILPGVWVQTGPGGRRLAFHAAKSIRISRRGKASAMAFHNAG
jgi:hypothetical protein